MLRIHCCTCSLLRNPSALQSSRVLAHVYSVTINQKVYLLTHCLLTLTDYKYNCQCKYDDLHSKPLLGCLTRRLFQACRPATQKARSPVLVSVPGTKTSEDFDDCSHNLVGVI